MDLPISWLKEYVDIDCGIKEYVDRITLSGSKVEGVTDIADGIKNVVVGRMEKIEKHPDADKLFVTEVNVGADNNLQIVTGADNLKVGDYVPVALHGAALANGVQIKRGKLRGETSEGMLCSIQELGFDLHDFPEACEYGIYVFPESYEPGSDALDALDVRDSVVEFEITSNRPDCFSILGLARESAATFDKELKYPNIEVKEKAQGNAADMIAVQIDNPELCQRYIARVVKNVKVEPSPRWMRKRLRAAGVRPINNIVDITNYVMLELGQPMHAFDIDDIEERKIIVRNAVDGEEITTLDGNQRKLDSSMLVISDAKKAVAVAGVMGGENSKVSGEAEAILFESACFNGPNVRLTAKKLGLRTDASAKYEKGLDPNLAYDAVNRAVQLVELLGAGDVVPGMVDCYPNKRESWTLEYSPDRINALLGTDISGEEMALIFEKIEIKVDREGHKATIPTFRPDLESEADLAEEVARFYGYDKIEPTLAAGTPTVGKRTYSQTIKEIIKTSMTANGLCEAMSFTFESPKVFDKLRIPGGSPLRNAVTISNPLGEDFSVMRTTTLNGMLNSLAINYNRRNDEAALFQLGKIYLPKSLPLTELPDEVYKLTIGMYGEGTDFYSLKGIAESLFDRLGIKGVQYRADKALQWGHPGRTADVLINGESLGFIAELHPGIAENYGIGARAYIAVLDVESLIDSANLVNRYRPLPKFPAITRDISMLVKDDIFVSEIEGIIYEKGGSLVERVKLFDVYKGKQILDGHKSVSYSITFRSPERTLTDDEVGAVMEKILKELATKLDAELRDK